MGWGPESKGMIEMAGGGTTYDTFRGNNWRRAGSDDDERFVLERVDDRQWTLLDRRSNIDNDVLAYITEIADEDSVIVSWCSRVPLGTRYLTLDDVLAELREWSERTPGHSKPNRIPSYPPLR
ncbi:hypothetical protein FHX49_001457 [Microbacterium endophyticum]|uniref:Uncharacterized protein n=1 Tax=Microbacterium endophyticum TaxID=1526412 RepID=A0A7W4V421_9MICO|nr:hypothetical protein [Microbacterium endophyticum]MBB2975890.1 hypothetical protein [Microbacterium endophyticum]NIK36373.1 hypothetical protein [Microbacterium endophyticum]